MRTLKSLALASSLVVGASASAQDAVEWRVADGGNGHWYGYGRVQISDATFLQANDAAVGAGGHLPTVTSANENTFVFQNIGGGLGLFRQPGGAWQNITGEPVSYQNWAPGDPNGSTTALVLQNRKLSFVRVLTVFCPYTLSRVPARHVSNAMRANSSRARIAVVLVLARFS